MLQKKVLHGRLLCKVGRDLPFAVDDAHVGAMAKEVPVRARPESTLPVLLTTVVAVAVKPDTISSLPASMA